MEILPQDITPFSLPDLPLELQDRISNYLPNNGVLNLASTCWTFSHFRALCTTLKFNSHNMPSEDELREYFLKYYNFHHHTARKFEITEPPPYILGILANYPTITSISITCHHSISSSATPDQILESLTQLQHLPSLRQFSLQLGIRDVQEKDFQFLQYISKVSELRLSSNCFMGIALFPAVISQFTNLKSLALEGWHQVKRTKVLSSLTRLTELSLANCTSLSELGGLATLTNLSKLNLQDIGRLVPLSPLTSLQQLKILNLGSERQAGTLHPNMVPRLQDNYGAVSKLAGLRDIKLNVWIPEMGTSLAGLTSLTSLHVEGEGKSINLNPISEIPHITRLKLSLIRIPPSTVIPPTITELCIQHAITENLIFLSPLTGLKSLTIGAMIVDDVKSPIPPLEIEVLHILISHHRILQELGPLPRLKSLFLSGMYLGPTEVQWENYPSLSLLGMEWTDKYVRTRPPAHVNVVLQVPSTKW